MQPLSVTVSTFHHDRQVFSQGALLYLVHGSGELWFTNQTFTFNEKCVYLLPHHSTIIIHAAKPLAAMICTWPNQEIHTVQDRMVFIPNSPDLKAVMTLLAQEEAQAANHVPAMKALAELLRIFCMRHADTDVHFKAIRAASRECDIVNDYLAANYTQVVTLEQLANLVHRDKYSLAHLYQRTIGHTIMEELKSIRLLHAKEQLLKNNLPIKEIARSCGFTSSAYFIESFRRQNQITPLQYRKAHHRKKQ